jgi:hypothetical protein
MIPLEVEEVEGLIELSTVGRERKNPSRSVGAVAGMCLSRNKSRWPCLLLVIAALAAALWMMGEKEVRVTPRCDEVRFESNWGLGNQLFFAMSAGLAAAHLNLSSTQCTVRLAADRYGQGIVENMRSLNFDVDALAAPCRVIGPGEPWQSSEARVIHKLDWHSENWDPRNQTVFTSDYVNPCGEGEVIVFDMFSNWCNVAGWFKLDEVSEADFVKSCFDRAQMAFRSFSTSNVTDRTDDNTLCVYRRGREKEVNMTYGGVHKSTFTSELTSLRTQLEGLTGEIEQFNHLRIVSMYSSDDVLDGLNLTLPHLLPHRNSSAVCESAPKNVEHEAPTPCLREALDDMLEMSQCGMILFDQVAAKVSNFALFSWFAGNMTSTRKGYSTALS